ncbi:ZapG family protein [Marinomonas posidonica]|uniref:Uncharacterized protein n=1 Tax=Marinomonas posidonica (strain CECT 7376 / NCIMB 14433 / IVIA-Po-181) TaxID=491952 RepID=F6CSE7_MARPP|nr:DUF1043 family protein [Marinomonas posidonica]AEF55001.1 protein of unknown function DUF1043 [Marinomonas posidonica IVIA-Po-181]
MNLEEFNVIVFITGIIVGSIATYSIKNLLAKNNTKQSDTTNNLVTMKSLQQELDNKQVIIDNFFADSNEQILMIEKRLTELKNNLASNASQLSNVKVNVAPTSQSFEENISAEPPRDYALKKEQDQGMLSEAFGLNNPETELEPKRGI